MQIDLLIQAALLTIVISYVTIRVAQHVKPKNDRGVTMVEYAILLAVIAIAAMVATPSISSAVRGVFSNATSIMVRPN